MKKIEKKMEQIYILKRKDGLVKIGRSTNAQCRVDSIASIGGFQIDNVFYSNPCSNGNVIEKTMHDHFKDFKIKGEWFCIDFSECVNYLCSVYERDANVNVKYENVITPEDIDELFEKKEISRGNKEKECTSNGLEIKNFNCYRVVTFADIDLVHERPSGTAKRNFNRNKQHFIDGEDYFKVSADEIRTRKIFDIPDRATEDYTLLTETGYLMVVKSFKDDLSWKVQRQLVNEYFRARKMDFNIKQQSSLPELEQNEAPKYLTTTTKCPLANPFYSKHNEQIRNICLATGITKKQFYFQMLRHLSDKYDLKEAERIYKKEVGHKPKYSADIIGYFPDLMKDAEEYLDEVIFGKRHS